MAALTGVLCFCDNSEHESAIANCPAETEHFRPTSTSTPCSTKQPRHELESPSIQVTIVLCNFQQNFEILEFYPIVL